MRKGCSREKLGSSTWCGSGLGLGLGFGCGSGLGLGFGLGLGLGFGFGLWLARQRDQRAGLDVDAPEGGGEQVGQPAERVRVRDRHGARLLGAELGHGGRELLRLGLGLGLG